MFRAATKSVGGVAVVCVISVSICRANQLTNEQTSVVAGSKAQPRLKVCVRARAIRTGAIRAFCCSVSIMGHACMHTNRGTTARILETESGLQIWERVYGVWVGGTHGSKRASLGV